jgi:hypothetical protein
MLDAFGPGVCIVTRTDVANATPVNVGFAQSVNFEFNGNIKELFGQNQFPLDAARGTVKASAKVKAAVMSGLAWNGVFFGNSFTTGSVKWAFGETGTIPTTPFQITVTNTATFDKDLGVINASTGLPYVKVASSPATGQYSVSGAGVYTFAAADTGKSVLINYTYTSASTGQTLTINNQLLGSSPIFQLDYYTIRNNLPFVARFNQCQSNKLSFASQLEDFIMPEFDISMFADATGTVGKLYFPEVS